VILAQFSGGQITVADMEDAIAKQLPRTRVHMARPGGREQFLHELIDYDLLVMEAERRGYRKRFAIEHAAKQSAIDAMFARDLRVDPAAIPAPRVAEQYTADSAKWNQPALKRASYIEVATEQEARALITGLRGADAPAFAKLAVQQSIDPRTQRQGGELGYFDADGRPQGDPNGRAADPELVKAVFALKRVGEITRTPIAHAGKFGVLMLTAERPAMHRSLAEVGQSIREELAETEQVKAFDALLESLRTQYSPEVKPELLSQIVLPSGSDDVQDIPQGFPAAPNDPRAPPKLVKPDAY
jgi:hypothetical protein